MKKVPSTTKLIIGIAPLFLGSGIFGVTSPTFLMSIGAGADVLGSASSLGLILAVLFSPFFGRLGRRFSNRNATFTCLVINALTVFLCVLFPSVTSFTICRAVLRFVPTCAAVCSYAYLINMSDGDTARSRAMVAMSTLSISLPTLGYLVGGFLAERSPILSFTVEACLMLFTTPLILMAEKDQPSLESLGSIVSIVKQENPITAFYRCVKCAPKGLMLFFLLLALISLGYTAFDQSFNYHLQATLNLSASYSGIVRCVIGAAAILTNFTLVMWVVKRFNGASSIFIATAICAAASLLSVLLDTRLSFICFGALFYIVINIALSLQQKIFGDLVAGNNSELMTANSNVVDNLASAIAAYAAGMIYEVNPSYPFYLGAAAFFLAAFIAILLFKRTGSRAKASAD